MLNRNRYKLGHDLPQRGEFTLWLVHGRPDGCDLAMPSFVRVGCGLVVRSGGFLSRKWMSRKPQPACGDKRLYSAVPPPRSFIAAAMNLTVMRPAQRHGELIAHLATERTRLRKTHMVRIRWTPTANQTRLFDDMPDMIAVTNPAARTFAQP